MQLADLGGIEMFRNMMQLVLLILLNSLGFHNEVPKARLGKKLTLREKLVLFSYKYEYELLFVITILMMVTFVLVVFAVVPPMDLWNNHFEEMI